MLCIKINAMIQQGNLGAEDYPGLVKEIEELFHEEAKVFVKDYVQVGRYVLERKKSLLGKMIYSIYESESTRKTSQKVIGYRIKTANGEICKVSPIENPLSLLYAER